MPWIRFEYDTIYSPIRFTNYLGWFLVIVKSTFVSVFKIYRSKGTSSARAGGVLMVKILNKCILSILVYNLYLDRYFIYTAVLPIFHTPVYWLSS